MAKHLIFILLSVFILSACGPEESARDAEDKDSENEIAEKTKIYSQFVGDYYGDMPGATGKLIQVKLILKLFNVYVPNPKDNSVDEIPNLAGDFLYCSGTKNKKCKGGQWVFLAGLDRGAFNKNITVLAMTGRTQVGKDATLQLYRIEGGFDGTYVGGIRSDLTLLKESQ